MTGVQTCALPISELDKELSKAKEAHLALQNILGESVRDTMQLSTQARLNQSIDYVLVVYASRVAEQILTERRNPDNCILICGQQMRSFFGDVLSGRAFTTLSGDVVNVNTAPEPALLAVHGIGPARCQAIIKARTVRPFVDMAEFSIRTRIFDSKILAQLQIWDEPSPEVCPEPNWEEIESEWAEQRPQVGDMKSPAGSSRMSLQQRIFLSQLW